MVWKKYQVHMGSISVDLYFEKNLMVPVEVLNKLVCVFLLKITANCIHQTTNDVLCGDIMAVLVSSK